MRDKTERYINHSTEIRAEQESKMTISNQDTLWPCYDSDLNNITFTFKERLSSFNPPFNDMSTYIEYVRDNTIPYGLEIAGQGKCFKDLKIDGVACSLAFPEFLKAEEKGTGLKLRRDPREISRIALVEGDIRTTVTKQEMVSLRELIAPAGFHLSIFRPAGAVFEIIRTSENLKDILTFMYNNMNNENGLILFEIPGYALKVSIDWITELQSRGVRIAYDLTEVDMDVGTLALIKDKNTPYSI